MDRPSLHAHVARFHVDADPVVEMAAVESVNRCADRTVVRAQDNEDTYQVISPSCRMPKSRDSVRWNICVQLSQPFRSPSLNGTRSFA